VGKKIACPGCGQGWVRHVRVRVLKRDLYVCEECETTWLSEQGIGVSTPTNFMSFMEEHGLKDTWNEVEQLS